MNGIDTPVIKRFPINLGRRDRVGIEANSSVRWSTKWRTNLSFNLFKSTEYGEYEGRIFDNKNASWTGNFRNNVTVLGNLSTQINLWFRGPTRSAFGSRKAFGGLNFGISKDLFKENASINLNFSDVFNSSIYRYKTNTENVFTIGEYQRRKPVYRLTFTYRFRQDKERQRGDGNGERGEGGYEL